MPDLKDILNDDDELRNEDLLKYVQGGLSDETQHKVERQMADSDFVSDAMEGLQGVRNKKSIEQYVDELNAQLHKQVSLKKQRKEKRRLKDQPWIVIAVVVVLGLCITAYAVIRYYHKQKNAPQKPATQQVSYGKGA